MKVASRSTSSWLRPPAGSSSSRRRGSATSARASSMRLSVPNGSPEAGRSARSSISTYSRTSRDAGPGAPARVRSDEDVLEHRHRREELDVLERSRDAAPDDPVRRRAEQALAVERDLAGLRAVEASDHVEGSRLAGAVRADQAGDLALLHLERDVVQRDDAAEAARDVLQLEERHQARPWTRSRRRPSTRSPFARRPSWSYSFVTQGRRPRIVAAVCSENSRST